MGPRRRGSLWRAGFALALAVAATAIANRASAADTRRVSGAVPVPAAGEVAKGASEAIVQYVQEREALQTHARRRWPLDETRLLGSTFLQTEGQAEPDEQDLAGTLEEVAAQTQGHATSPGFYERAFSKAAAQLDGADDHSKLVAHLTQRLTEVAGKVHQHTPHEERLAALKATAPVLLQLAHVAKSPVAFFPRAADRHSDEQSRCFACIYLLQRAATNTAPYSSAAAMNYGPENLSRQFKDSGKAPPGMPVEFPARSAYPENRAPYVFRNGPFDAMEPGGAAGAPYESLRRTVEGSSSAAPPSQLADSDGAKARHLMDPKLWPELDFSEDESQSGDDADAEESGDEDASLLQTGWGEPRGPIDGIRWGPIPPEAYVLNNERPPIGPRVLPPVPQAPTEVEQKFGKPSESTGSPSFMTRADVDKPFTDLPMVMAMPQDLTGPPPLAPQALVRAIEAGDFAPPPRPMVPGLSIPAKTNLGMLEAPAMDMDVRSFDAVGPHNDPLAPLGRDAVIPMLLQTGGMPDEARGTVPGLPDSIALGSSHGERTSLSASAAELFDSETTLPSGPSPNTVQLGVAGAGKAESPESGAIKGGMGATKLLGGFKTMMLQRKLAKADPDSAEFRKLLGKLEAPKIMDAQKRRSAQQPEAPGVGPFKKQKDLPLGSGWGGGDGGERFDNPQDIAMLNKYVAKEGKLPKKLEKAMPKGKDALHLPQTNPEAGLFGDEPRTERDSILSRPTLLSDNPDDFLAASGAKSLLQEQATSERGRAASTVRRHAARAQAQLSSEEPEFTQKDSSAVARGLKNSVLFMREKKRPLPHTCRKGEKLCRQRLRSLTPFAMRRKIRRLLHRQRMDALMSAWGLAITQLCTVNPSLGQPLPPHGDEEDSGTPFASVAMVAKVKASLKQVLATLAKKRPALEAAIGPINLEALMEGNATRAFDRTQQATTGGAKSGSILKQLGKEAMQVLPTTSKNKGIALAQKELDSLTSLSSALTSLHKALKAFDMWNNIGLGGGASGAAAAATGMGKHAQEALAQLANLLLHKSAFESVRTQARVFDKDMESGYDGARPPPRLQSDGLDSAGHVTAQPFTSWVTEPTRFGDNPAVGQMPDLGLPTIIQQYCGVIKERLDLLSDAYLHGFDMEEMCGIANMCGNKRLGIYLNNEPTTIKARAFEAIAG